MVGKKDMLTLTEHYFEASNSRYCLQLVFQSEELTNLNPNILRELVRTIKLGRNRNCFTTY